MTAFIVPIPLVGAAIEGRGGFTWSFAADQARLVGWPAIAQGATILPTLTLTGHVDLAQRTPGLDAAGVGSARVDMAVVGGAAARWLSPVTFTNPAANPVWIRLILRDVRLTGTATYFEISQTAQRYTIRRNGTLLEVIGALGTYTEMIDLEPFLGAYLLLDVFATPTGFAAFLNGIDFTPSFVGGALAAFAGLAQIALQNNVAGSDVAFDTALVFAGVSISAGPTIEQHRMDAWRLGVLVEELAIEGLGGWTWAWSPNRIDTATAPAPTLPGEPDFGDLAARLNITGTVELQAETDALRTEGLGRPRLDRAFAPTEAAARIYRGAPSGLEAIDGDVHVRLIFRVDSTGASAQRLVSIEDEFDLTRRLSIEVNPTNGDLTIHAPTAYDRTLAATVSRDRYHLLDVSLDRNDGTGHTQIVVQLDGAAIAVTSFFGPVDDIREDASVVIFDDRAFLGAATATRIAFLGIARGRILSLVRHVVDALALGVV